MWSLDASILEFNKKKVWIFGEERFIGQFENLEFLKINPWFETRYKHRFKTTADAMKGQSIYSHIL